MTKLEEFRLNKKILINDFEDLEKWVIYENDDHGLDSLIELQRKTEEVLNKLEADIMLESDETEESSNQVFELPIPER